MRRRRFQNPEPKRRKHGRCWVWVGQYRDIERVPRSKVLGKCSQMSKGEAEAMLAAILAPINAGVPRKQTAVFTFRHFVTTVYLPFARRKWKKRSTAMTTEPTINLNLVEPLGPRLLGEILREDLQNLLDQKAPMLSFSVVDHLRWHLRAIYELAISEGAVDRNPAMSLFTPKCKAGRERRDLTPGDINLMFEVLDLRERIAVKFAIFEGMRPGEILALRWRNIGEESFTVEERVYRGVFDTPKTKKSLRVGGLSRATIEDLKAWSEMRRDPSPAGFVFPSEKLTTPLNRDNLWRRNIQPRLQKVGLGWASFQVMRRANANLGRRAGVDDKVAADQRGHGIGVSLDVYANSDLSQKVEAVRKLEAVVFSETDGDGSPEAGFRRIEPEGIFGP